MMETRTTSVSAYCGSSAASSTGSGRSEAETVPLSTLVKATSSPPAARRGTAKPARRATASNRESRRLVTCIFMLILLFNVGCCIFRAVARTKYPRDVPACSCVTLPIFVVYVCNIPHCAQIVNRFRGESRDSISFFHPGGGAPLAFPQGRRKAPWDFITVKGTRYVFAGSVCRSVMAIPHPPRSAGYHPPGKARRSWAENVRRCLKIRFETPPRRFHYVSNTRSSCRRKWRTAS